MKHYPLKRTDLKDDELVIGNKIYDISTFKKIHPGGSIINFFSGSDASEPFKEFHYRSSTKVNSVLENIPSRPIEASHQSIQESAVLSDFKILRAQLEQEGYFEPSYLHIFYRVMELLLMHVLGLYLFFHNWKYLGLILFSIGNGRCGWFMHEAGHGSITGIPKIDKYIQAVTFALGNTCSGSYWNNQHNKHHATPQKLNHDIDLNTLPLVAFCKEIAAGATHKFWLKFQAYLFAPVVTWLVVLGWALYLHPRWMIRNNKYLEFFFYALRVILIDILVFGIWFTWLNAVIGGIYIFVNFSLSHTHLPVIPSNEFPDWVEFSAYHTTNIEPSLLCNWWMGYLNFQIEHHLFPSMPQFKQQYIAPRVEQFFKKHGLPYMKMSYTDALFKTFNNLNEVGMSS